MKATHKLGMLTLFTIAWIGLWGTGPETPGDKYSSFDTAMFAVVLIGCFVLSVRFCSQLAQERYDDELKRKLRRRDSRPGR